MVSLLLPVVALLVTPTAAAPPEDGGAPVGQEREVPEGEAFTLRTPTLEKPRADEVFSLILSFRNPSGQTVVHRLADETTTVEVTSGGVTRSMAVRWSLEQVEIPAGQAFAVFGALALPAGRHQLVVEHSPSRTRRTATVEVLPARTPESR